MDAARFDALLRSLTDEAPSRRTLMRALAGGLVATGLVGAPAVAAKKCKAGRKRCGKKCVDLNTNRKHCGACKNACFVDIACVAGQCQCRDLGADCEVGGQCCSGRCSTVVVSTCRKANCVETGLCAVDTDCCGGFCVNGCCNGVC